MADRERITSGAMVDWQTKQTNQDKVNYFDLNQLGNVLRKGINLNFQDVIRLKSGELTVGNSTKFDGNTLSKFATEVLQDDDTKVPSSKQIIEALKAYLKLVAASQTITGNITLDGILGVTGDVTLNDVIVNVGKSILASLLTLRAGGSIENENGSVFIKMYEGSSEITSPALSIYASDSFEIASDTIFQVYIDSHSLILDSDGNFEIDGNVIFNTGNVRTSFQATPDNEHVVSEKLVKDQLDLKVDKVTGKSLVLDTEIAHLIALDTQAELDAKFDLKATNVDLALRELLSNKATAFSSTPGNTKYPTEKLVKDSLDSLQAELEPLFKDISLNETNYQITFTKYDDSTVMIDLPIEQLVVSGSYDEEEHDLIFLLDNGTEITVPVDAIFTGLATQTWVTTQLGNYYLKTEIDQMVSNQNDAIALKIDKDFHEYEVKSTLVEDDLMLLNDSEDENKSKKISVSNLLLNLLETGIDGGSFTETSLLDGIDGGEF